MSPLLDFDCPRCGIRERLYHGEPPEFCPDCGSVHATKYTRLHIGGELAWMKGKELDAIETQLGVRPDSPEQLRRLEKRLGVVRLDKKELDRRPDGPSEHQQKQKLVADIDRAFEQGKRKTA